MDVNKVMHSVSNLLTSKPNITSHSFRIGYISQLWKDTKDIEFVRQTMIRNNAEKPFLVQAVLNGAEDAGCGDNIAFINFE